ncbi:MAG: hypothetical protein ACREPG_03260 [Candidatus Binatia bacterium]
MKSFAISIIFVALATAPLSAGLITSEEGDQRAQCGMRAARMIFNGSEDSVIFPEDVTNCRELDGETGRESNVDSLRLDPANGSAGSERPTDLATISPEASR